LALETEETARERDPGTDGVSGCPELQADEVIVLSTELASSDFSAPGRTPVVALLE